MTVSGAITRSPRPRASADVPLERSRLVRALELLVLRDVALQQRHRERAGGPGEIGHADQPSPATSTTGSAMPRSQPARLRSGRSAASATTKAASAPDAVPPTRGAQAEKRPVDLPHSPRPPRESR